MDKGFCGYQKQNKNNNNETQTTTTTNKQQHLNENGFKQRCCFRILVTNSIRKGPGVTENNVMQFLFDRKRYP